MTERPSDWIETHFLVPDPRDVKTGENLPAGPIRLTEHQRRIVNEALSKKEDGSFKYSTVVYSAPKKSGKSALTSAVMFYMAWHNANSYVVCAANDGKQSADRLYAPIYTCLRLHKQVRGPMQGIEPNLSEVILPNYTKIEAIPCDAAGEAGSQPLFVAFSELWAFETERKRRLFTEMTLPPTLHGRAMRWIETYAGYAGVSALLEGIYETGFIQGSPHPDFLDLQGRDGPVVRVNEAAGLFVYWDSEPRMVWQSSRYYEQEAALLPPAEFQRIHRNQWVSPIGAFIEEGWWKDCENPALSPLRDGDKTPVVVGIDMSVSRDCAALVAVTRDPFNPGTGVAVRAVRIFSPKQHGGIIDQEMLIRPVIEDWAKRWNVVCWVYDPREMSKLAQDLVRAGLGWFKPFGQQNPRAISDKQLHDMVMHKEITWNRHTTLGDVGEPGTTQETLYRHMTQAGATTRGESYRLEKLSNSAKIDGAVALSQAAYVAMSLAIGNAEGNPQNLVRLLQTHQISVEEFSRRVVDVAPQLKERMIND